MLINHNPDGAMSNDQQRPTCQESRNLARNHREILGFRAERTGLQFKRIRIIALSVTETLAVAMSYHYFSICLTFERNCTGIGADLRMSLTGLFIPLFPT